MVDIEKKAGEVRSLVSSHASSASVSVHGNTVEVDIKGAEFKASASDDLSEVKAAIRKDLESRFGYDIDVVIGIEASR